MTFNVCNDCMHKKLNKINESIKYMVFVFPLEIYLQHNGIWEWEWDKGLKIW